MQGVPKHKVVLEKHCDEWAAEFERTKQLLRRIHGDNIVDIQHVGSTAIEGIVAKPMLDVAILFKLLDDSVFSAMTGNGYEYYGEVAEGKHLFILRGKKEESLQHIHCYAEKASELFYEQIRFRDFIRSHSEYAREYELLKLELCQLYANDRKKYTVGKQSFFDTIKELSSGESKKDECDDF